MWKPRGLSPKPVSERNRFRLTPLGEARFRMGRSGPRLFFWTLVVLSSLIALGALGTSHIGVVAAIRTGILTAVAVGSAAIAIFTFVVIRANTQAFGKHFWSSVLATAQLRYFIDRRFVSIAGLIVAVSWCIAVGSAAFPSAITLVCVCIALFLTCAFAPLVLPPVAVILGSSRIQSLMLQARAARALEHLSVVSLLRLPESATDGFTYKGFGQFRTGGEANRWVETVRCLANQAGVVILDAREASVNLDIEIGALVELDLLFKTIVVVDGKTECESLIRNINAIAGCHRTNSLMVLSEERLIRWLRYFSLSSNRRDELAGRLTGTLDADTRPANLSEQEARAFILFWSAPKDEARTLLATVVRSDADNTNALALLAGFEPATGSADRAVECADLLVQSGYCFAHQVAGDVLFNCGRLDKAQEQFAAATRHQPENVGAWINLALSLERLERNDEALAAVERAILLDSMLFIPLLAKARLLMKLKHFDLAHSAAKRTSRLYPAEAEPYVLAAKACVSLQSVFRAELEFLDAYDIDPSLDTLRWIARCVQARRKWRRAIALWDRILQQDPLSLEALKGKAAAQSQLGHFEGAVNTSRRVIEIEMNTDSQCDLAFYLYKAGWFESAIAELEKAADRDDARVTRLRQALRGAMQRS